jgi:hypothetical protein
MRSSRSGSSSPAYLRSWIVAALVLPCLAAVAACSGDEKLEKLCTPDANVFCRCDDRTEGTKKCGSDGRSFGECKCTAKADGATTPKSKSNPSDTASDQSASDTTAKKKTSAPSTNRSADAPATGTDATSSSNVLPVVEDPAIGADFSSGSASSPTCDKLQLCCDAERRMGITGTADNCDRIVAAKDDHGCQVELTASAIPDDFYDPPAACK